MWLTFSSLCVLLALFPSSDAAVAASAPRRKLLLVSFDGFRASYLERNSTPTFNAFRREGSTARYVTPTFPSVTFACHYAIATGRHASHHGIVANSFYDSQTNRTFKKDMHEQHWWNYNSTLPIWITAKMNGLKVGIYFFPGSEVAFTIDNTTYRPDYWMPYDQTVAFEKRADAVVSWLKNDSVDFAVLYSWEPDSSGHQAGPDSTILNDALKTVDSQFAYLLQRIEQAGLKDQLNIVVVSDHGMQHIDKTIYLDTDLLIPKSHFTVYEDGPLLLLDVTSEGNKTDIYNKLKSRQNLTVYYHDEVPDRFVYNGNPRISQMVAMADPGVCVKGTQPPCATGDHGYDNQLESMRAMFIANGPDFRPGLVIDPISQTDIYPLLAHLLQVPPQPHDGNLEAVRQVLVASASAAASLTSSSSAYQIIARLALGAAAAIVLSNRFI